MSSQGVAEGGAAGEAATTISTQRIARMRMMSLSPRAVGLQYDGGLAPDGQHGGPGPNAREPALWRRLPVHVPCRLARPAPPGDQATSLVTSPLARSVTLSRLPAPAKLETNQSLPSPPVSMSVASLVSRSVARSSMRVELLKTYDPFNPPPFWRAAMRKA